MRPVNSRLYCEYKPPSTGSSSNTKIPTRQSSSNSISNKVQQVHPISESSCDCETKSKDSVVSICKSVSYSCLSRLSFLSPFGGNGCVSEPSLNLAPISGSNSEERGSGATSMGAIASTMPSAAKRKAFSDLPESPRSNGPENGDISSSPNPIRAERHIENIGCSAEEALKQVAAAKVAVVHCSENISQFESLVSSASSEVTITAIRVSEAAKKIIQDVTLLQQWPIAYVKGDPVGNEESLKKIADNGVLAEWLKDHTYDLIVIGGGSGGLAAAKEAARLGKKVACLDFVKPSPQGTTWGLGGTCVNVGCIPKKLMHQASILGHSIKDAEKFGWTLPEGEVTHSWTKMKGAIQDHIASLNWGYRVQLREKTVTYVNSYGTFTGPFEISATNKKGKVEKLTANRFLVSTGLRPKYPEIPGAKEYTISSDDLFSLPYAPGKTLCVGASYVSLECAGFLHGVGFDVTVMVRSILLRGFDQDIAERIRKHMIEYGVKFESGVPSRIEQLEAKTADKPGLLRVFWEKTTEDGTKKEVSEDYNTVLMAIGREAATNDCGLDLVGVTRSKTGKLVGRREQSVSCPYVYAIGDVLENTPELTPVAIQAGKVLMRRLYEGTRELTEYDQIPTTVFTPLEYGCCGLAEEDALKKYGKDNVIIYHAAFLPLEYTVAERMDKEHCYCKLICLKNENERVVGYHILTPWAGEVTQGFAIALKLGGTKADFDRLIGIHPTVAENFTTLTSVKQEGVELKASGC